jgi:IMP cyclohydrolase
MEQRMEIVKNMVYPGRIIIIGTSPAGTRVVLYSITGRSPSSQARRLEIDQKTGSIFVKPTDEETLKTGNPDLLVYPAVICKAGAIAVSNGKQTDDVAKFISAAAEPVDVLLKSLASWEYEPDSPNFTPRISGCVTKGAALSVLKRAADGSVICNLFTVPAIAGKGSLIATYTGENVNPLPSFSGEPKEVGISWATADEAAAGLYEALGPKAGGDDFRVTAAAVYMAADGSATMSVKNRHK